MVSESTNDEFAYVELDGDIAVLEMGRDSLSAVWIC